jgi:FlaA1/EpsC-like NDP-sugar epimerase
MSDMLLEYERRLGYSDSVLVTGGTGFLARGLVRQLLEDGCERVCVYSRGEYAQSQMRTQFADDKRLRWFIGDVRDKERLELAMERVDAVIHAAALKRIEVGAYQPGEMVKTNVIGSQNVIEAARRQKVGKVLLISSDKAFEPVSPYGQTKALAESLFLTANDIYPHGPRFSIVRYGNVFNSTGSLVPTWKALVAAGAEAVPVTNPDCTRFFMRLEEAVQLVLGTLSAMRGGEVEVPTLPAYRVADMAAAMGMPMQIGALQKWEKMHESMADGVRSDTARRMRVAELEKELASV